MECHEFSRKDLETYAHSWSMDMEEGLWHKIWDHARTCPSCSAVIRQAYETRRKEESLCRQLFPGLAAIADALFERRWADYNWKERWFHDARRRKQSVRDLVKR